MQLLGTEKASGSPNFSTKTVKITYESKYIYDELEGGHHDSPLHEYPRALDWLLTELMNSSETSRTQTGNLSAPDNKEDRENSHVSYGAGRNR